MINKKTLSIISVVVVAFVAGGFAYMQFQQSNIDEQQTADVSKKSGENESDTKQDNQDLPDNMPPLRFPSLVGVAFEYNDDTSDGNNIPLRTFTVPSDSGKSFPLTAAYQSYFSNKDSNSSKITDLTGGGAAFSDIYQQDLGSSDVWKSIIVQIGDSAQDECGDDIGIVYLLSNSEVAAVFSDDTPVKHILDDSQCPRKPENLITEKAIADFAHSKSTGVFCKERADCIQKYFENSDNKKKLQSKLLNLVRDLKIE